MNLLRRTTALAAAAATAATLLVLAPGTPASAGVSNLTVLGPLVTLKSGDATPAGGASAAVTVARNEFESFQVAVRADANGIASLQTELAGPLTGARGGVLPADALTIYREQYYDVAADHLSDGESSVGGWPDALVPQVDPIYHQARSAFSTPVPANGRAVLWVDVLAGRDQVPDVYTGTLRIKDGATVIGTVPVQVTVRNLVLPSTSSLESVFPNEPTKQCQVHTGSGTCNGDTVEANRLSAVYERVALENRITLSTPWQIDRSANLTGAMQTNWRAMVKPIINGTDAPASVGSPIRLPGAKATNLVLWHYCKAACIDGWKAEAAAGGFADRLSYYTCDEPNQDATRWANCSANHSVAQSKGMRELVTTPLPYAQSNGADDWIDDMVVLARMMDGRNGTFAGNQRPTYDGWKADATDGQDNRVWIYNSCEAAACNNPGDEGWNSPFYNGWAGYGIDQPGSQARAMPWTAFVYNATGELYWGVDYRLGQAWNTCGAGGSNCLYESGMNGDGTLFYPGKACPPAPGTGCIGGTTDIPIESIRLKRIRDGREDYEYLRMAADDPATASLARSTALNLLGGNIEAAAYSTTFSQSALDNARDALGDALEEPFTPDPEPASLSISDASITEGTGDDRIMTFTVTGTGDVNGYADVRAVSETADASDFELLDTSVEMNTQETRVIRVRITGDALAEPTETFRVELWNNTNLGLADGSGTGTINDDDGPSDAFRPDAMVRLGTRSFIGNNVYNTTGANQTIQLAVRQGVSKTFTVRVGNDGNTADNWSLAETRSNVTGLTRTWTYGGSNVTSAVRGGTLSLLDVPASGARSVTFTVRPTRNAAIGQVATWGLHAVHNPVTDGIRDVVRIRIKVVA